MPGVAERAVNRCPSCRTLVPAGWIACRRCGAALPVGRTGAVGLRRPGAAGTAPPPPPPAGRRAPPPGTPPPPPPPRPPLPRRPAPPPPRRRVLTRLGLRGGLPVRRS